MRSYYRFPRDYEEGPIWLYYPDSTERFYRWLYGRANYKTGMISMSLFAYSHYSRVPLEKVKEAIKLLSEPCAFATDPKCQGPAITVGEDGVTICVLAFLNDQADTESKNSTERVMRHDLRNPGRKHRKAIYEKAPVAPVAPVHADSTSEIKSVARATLNEKTLPGATGATLGGAPFLKKNSPVSACADFVRPAKNEVFKKLKDDGTGSTTGKKANPIEPVHADSTSEIKSVARATLNEKTLPRQPINELTNIGDPELTASVPDPVLTGTRSVPDTGDNYNLKFPPVSPTSSPIGESSGGPTEKSVGALGKVNGKKAGALQGQREIEKLVAQTVQPNPPSTAGAVAPVVSIPNFKGMREINANLEKQSKDRANARWKECLKKPPGTDRVLFSLDDPEERAIKLDILEHKRAGCVMLKVQFIDDAIRVYSAKRTESLGCRTWVERTETNKTATLRIVRACLTYGFTVEELIDCSRDIHANHLGQEFPPLHTLGSDAYVQDVIANLVKAKDKPTNGKHKSGNGKVGSKTDFSSEDLHPEMRACLKAGGHDVRSMTNRDLISVQNYARQLARGIVHLESVGEPALRKMVNTAKILFQQTN